MFLMDNGSLKGRNVKCMDMWYFWIPI